MRRYLVIFVLGMMLGSYGNVFAADLDYLKEWDGLYGSAVGLNQKKIASGTFMKDKNVLQLVKSSLPPKIANTLINDWKDGAVESPISVVNDVLIYHKCKPHMCNLEWITLYIDLKSGLIQCVNCQYDDLKKYKDKVPSGYSPAKWYVSKEEKIIGVNGFSVDDFELYKLLNKK